MSEEEPDTLCKATVEEKVVGGFCVLVPQDAGISNVLIATSFGEIIEGKNFVVPN